MNEKTKDIFIRAAKTFWQAALSYLLADVSVLSSALTDYGAGKRILLTLGVGAVAAGFSAIYNGVIKPLLVSKPVE